MTEEEWWDSWWAEDYSWESFSDDMRRRHDSELPDFWAAEEKHLIKERDAHGTVLRRWSRYHLPLKFEDGTDTGKSSWPQHVWDDLVTGISEYIDESLQAGKDADLSGVVVSTLPPPSQDLDLSHLDEGAIPTMNAYHAFLINDLSWRLAKIQGDLSFWSCWFGGSVDLEAARFKGGYANFREGQFSGGDANFRDAKFSGGHANFDDAQFSGGDANFNGAEFSGGNALFGGAQFSGGNAHFWGAQFSGGAADFWRAQFSGGDAHFSSAQFSRGFANFWEAQFSGGASFHRAEFKGGVAIFLAARFSNKVIFQNADFRHLAAFQETIWPKRSIHYQSAFYNARFGSVADFTSTDDGPLFSAFAAFHGVLIERQIRLSRDVIMEDEAANRALKGVGDDLDTWLDEQTERWFQEEEQATEETQQRQTTDRLERDDLARPPPSYDVAGDETRKAQIRAELKAGPEYNNLTANYFHSLEQAARALQIGLDQGRDKLGEIRMYRLELLARKKHPKTSGVSKLMTSFYQTFSDFGGSVWLPLFWVLVAGGAFSLLYAGMYSLIQGDGWADHLWATLIEGLNFSGQAIFRPLFYWSGNDLVPEFIRGQMACQNDSAAEPSTCAMLAGWSLLLRVLATIQSFFSIIMFFLSGVAIRRFFQMR